jgi:prepilin signal peptidase PulO-like enzyme (type II secretory pathway)
MTTFQLAYGFGASTLYRTALGNFALTSITTGLKSIPDYLTLLTTRVGVLFAV